MQKRWGVATELRNGYRSCGERLRNTTDCNIGAGVARIGKYIDKNATTDYTGITKQRKPPTSKGGTEHEYKASKRNDGNHEVLF